MLYLILIVLVLSLVFGPHFWVRYTLKKYQRPLPDLPGTGGELAEHLLHRFGFDQVPVEPTEADGDHYNALTNTVCLSPEVLHGKSLSAVAIAAHEVGHALQFNRQEAVSRLRGRYLGTAVLVQKCGIYILMALPLVGLVLRVPHLTLLTGIIGFFTLFSSVLMYLAILPEEWDASFNKALPILEQGEYVSAEQLPAIRSILKACALTYVAAALADIFRLWRWLHLMR